MKKKKTTHVSYANLYRKVGLEKRFYSTTQILGLPLLFGWVPNDEKNTFFYWSLEVSKEFVVYTLIIISGRVY